MPSRRPPRTHFWPSFLCTALGVWLYLRFAGIPVHHAQYDEVKRPLKLLLRQQNATIHLLHASLALAIEQRGLAQEGRSGRGQHGAVSSPYVRATADSGASPLAAALADLPPWAPVELTRHDWIVYLRVQKTGSQTLWLTLIQSFDGHVWGDTRCAKGPFCGYYCDKVLASAFTSYQRDRKCRLFVRAHANLWDYSRAADLAGVPRQQIRWLAFLREPVARAKSEHEHVTHGLVAQFGAHAFGRAWDYNFTDRHNARLTDWLNCPACRVGSNNRQTRFLAGLAPTGSRDTDRFDDDALLAAALKNLGHCTFVGILERFADSMLLLRETFPVELARFKSYSLALHPTRKRRKADTTPADLERLRDLNQLDMKLYYAGLKIFELRWAAMLRSQPEHRRQLRFVRSQTQHGTGHHQRFVLS